MKLTIIDEIPLTWQGVFKTKRVSAYDISYKIGIEINNKPLAIIGCYELHNIGYLWILINKLSISELIALFRLCKSLLPFWLQERKLDLFVSCGLSHTSDKWLRMLGFCNYKQVYIWR